MYRKTALLFVIASQLSACSLFANWQPSQWFSRAKAAATKPTADLRQGFSTAILKGPMNLSLSSHCHSPGYRLKGDPTVVRQVIQKLEDGRLSLSLSKQAPANKVEVQLCSPNLQLLSYNGIGSIRGLGLKTHGLAVKINNQGSTQLSGNLNIAALEILGRGTVRVDGLQAGPMVASFGGDTETKLAGTIHLRQLKLRDNARLSLSWLKADCFKVSAKDNSYVQIAGSAKRAEIKAADCARVNGRFLRAKRIFVHTLDKSRADIVAIDRQHTLASDNSNIYFYKLPEMKSDFMADNGSVLDMRSLDNIKLKDYDRYTK